MTYTLGAGFSAARAEGGTNAKRAIRVSTKRMVILRSSFKGQDDFSRGNRHRVPVDLQRPVQQACFLRGRADGGRQIDAQARDQVGLGAVFESTPEGGFRPG